VVGSPWRWTLNLTRDQLDRAAEVRKTAEAITRAITQCPATTVFANADDPMAVWAVGEVNLGNGLMAMPSRSTSG
jgi:hypothetical protein